MKTSKNNKQTGILSLCVAILACGLVLLTSAPSALAETCPNEAFREAQASTFLSDCRAYELVSPPDKNGGSVVADTQRTRAAADGSAVGFAALTAFGDAIGTGVATDYMAVRDPQDTPGVGNGWGTHAITPLQSGTSFDGVTSGMEPLYVGEFTKDLASGVFYAQSPLTSDPFTTGVPNLYMRTDLRTPGAGNYQLVSACPLCASTGKALPALQLVQNGVSLGEMAPYWAGMSPDAQHVAFESRQPLTEDASSSVKAVKLYEWDRGTVSLAGRIPPAGNTECDDVTQAPACIPSGASIAGNAAGANYGFYRLVAHDVSDGSDGHTRVFFTRPTKPDGVTLDPSNFGLTGQLFMRTDDTSTVQINASERTTPDTTAPAQYWDASADGERVFFTTTQALTNDAPIGSTVPKFYMYDVTRPAGSRLTFLNQDNEPADGAGAAEGMIGASSDGNYVYFIAIGQLVKGGPLLHPSLPKIYLWHEGSLSYIGPSPINSFLSELYSGGTSPALGTRQARVTPDGRHLLFSAESGVGLGGYNHGECPLSVEGCREFYVYSADTGTVACVSCNPSGVPASAMATIQVRALNGSSQTNVHENEAIIDDGSRVFFSTSESLVPGDVNGKSDAYEWTADGTHGCHSTNVYDHGCVTLLSSGTSPDDSWFMDASTSGDDVFFVTDERLVGWDKDQSYDLYDARVNGGWPEPPPPTVACVQEECRGALSTPPVTLSFSSALQESGNPPAQTVSSPAKPKSKARPKPSSCPKNKRIKHIHGKTHCVKTQSQHRNHRSTRRGGK